MDNKRILELFDRYEEMFGEAPPTYEHHSTEAEILEAIETNTPIKVEIKEDVLY